MKTKIYILYLIAVLEGFTTLSVQITSLRIFSPVIGVNSISTSIIIGVILLAISYGYYIGGKISVNKLKIPKYLFRNLLISSIYYFFITFFLAEVSLQSSISIISSYFFSLFIVSLFLFFIPVYFASQTIPLLSELLKGSNNGKKVGKLLFYSTIGSFFGSIITSIVLFPIIGVYKTAIISPFLLILSCGLIIYYSKLYSKNYLVITILLFLFYSYKLIINIPLGENVIYEKSNAYHTIKIFNKTEFTRVLSLDGLLSSGINVYTGESIFNYIHEIKEQIIGSKNNNILIIGAAGFTLSNSLSDIESIRKIEVLDVDKDLKNISEQYFLEKKLSRKIRFYPESARFYLNKYTGDKYNIVVVDAYSGQSIPSQLLTIEFIEKLLTYGEDIYINIIMDKNLESGFSKKIFETISKGFGGTLYYKDVNNNTKSHLTNFIISNKRIKGYNLFNYTEKDIYTDNKNTIEKDLFLMNTQISK